MVFDLEARVETNPSLFPCPAQPNWETRIAATTQVQTVSLINLTKGRSNPAHGKKEQADDRHLNDAEMKNPPIDNGIQKE